MKTLTISLYYTYKLTIMLTKVTLIFTQLELLLDANTVPLSPLFILHYQHRVNYMIALLVIITLKYIPYPLTLRTAPYTWSFIMIKVNLSVLFELSSKIWLDIPTPRLLTVNSHRLTHEGWQLFKLHLCQTDLYPDIPCLGREFCCMSYFHSKYFSRLKVTGNYHFVTLKKMNCLNFS